MPKWSSVQKVVEATIRLNMVGQVEFTANSVSNVCGLSVPTCRRCLMHLSSLDAFTQNDSFAMLKEKRFHRSNNHKVVYSWLSDVDRAEMADRYGVSVVVQNRLV